nr:50s ribosomal protein l7/l12 [Quercus suber]
MSFILRFRHHLPNGLSRNPVVALNAINFSGFTRSFGQPARVEEEEEEEIDQRRLPTDYDPATFDPTEHRSPPTERVFRLVDEVSGLTLAEAAELGAIMMRKMGMKEPPTVGVLKPGAAGLAGMAVKSSAAAKEEKKPEKTVFEIKLESYEASAKIKIIKEVRGFTDLGLKEAKDLVEKTPSVLKRGLSKEEGEQIIEKLKALGAKPHPRQTLRRSPRLDTPQKDRGYDKGLQRLATLVFGLQYMIKVVVAPLIMQGLSSCTYLALNPKCLESVMIINTSLHLFRQLSIFSQLADHLEAFGMTTTVMAELPVLRDGLCQCHLWNPQMSIELDAFAGFY